MTAGVPTGASATRCSAAADVNRDTGTGTIPSAPEAKTRSIAISGVTIVPSD